MPGTGPSVDPTALTVIAAAVRGRMRFGLRQEGIPPLRPHVAMLGGNSVRELPMLAI
jgi:hypothetical protein